MTSPKFSEPTEHGRYYRNPNRSQLMPSVTNIKNMKNIPALPNWAAREAAEYANTRWDELSGLNGPERVALIKGAPWRTDPTQPSASMIGDIVHNWIDTMVKGYEVNPDVWIDAKGNERPAPLQARQMWRQVIGKGGWVDRYRPRYFASEFTVWSDKYGYAGTADLAAYVGRDWLTLIDHKTGANVYAETAIQLAALANADVIIQDDGTEIELPHFDKFAVLHIRPRGSKFVPVQHIDEAFKAFLGLKATFDWMIECEESTLMVAPKLEVRAAA